MSSGSTFRATPRPATRSSAASSASPRATPSTMSASAARATESSRSASSRTIWRSGRSRARRRTASCSASTSRSGRPASCSCRPVSRASSASCSACRSEQRNFRGRGQELRAGVNWSTYSRSAELGFTEPYLFDRNIAVGFDLFRRDYNSFNFIGDQRETTYEQVTTGGQIRAGVPLTENISLALRYGLTYDEIGLSQDHLFHRSGRRRAAAAGLRSADRRPLSVRYDRQPAHLLGRLFAALQHAQQLDPPDQRHARAAQPGFRRPRRRRALSAHPRSAPPITGRSSPISSSRSAAEGGYIHSFEDGTPTIDPVRLTDRFFLGSPQIRGFDIRGVGPRVQRVPYDVDARRQRRSDQLHPGHRPAADHRRRGRRPGLLSGPCRARNPARRGGPRPWPPAVRVRRCRRGLRRPHAVADRHRSRTTRSRRTSAPTAGGTNTLRFGACNTDETLTRGAITPFRERFLGDSPSPRLSVGFGVNWNSPFGPFRIDIARALLSRAGRRHQALHLQRRNRILMTRIYPCRDRGRARLPCRWPRRRKISLRRRRRRRRRRPHRPHLHGLRRGQARSSRRRSRSSSSARSSSAPRCRPRSRRSAAAIARAAAGAAARRGAADAHPHLPDLAAERADRAEPAPGAIQRNVSLRPPADRPAHRAGDQPR